MFSFFVITESALRKSLHLRLGVTLTERLLCFNQTSSQLQLQSTIIIIISATTIIFIIFSHHCAGLHWLDLTVCFHIDKTLEDHQPCCSLAFILIKSIHPSVCPSDHSSIRPSIHPSVAIKAALVPCVKAENRVDCRMRDKVRRAECAKRRAPPSPDLLRKTYTPVCFFSESSQREVAHWRPSDARREGRGRSPPPLLPQQRPCGLHPGHLIALQSSLFKEGGGGRLVVIFFSRPHTSTPPPPAPHAPTPRLRQPSLTSAGRT